MKEENIKQKYNLKDNVMDQIQNVKEIINTEKGLFLGDELVLKYIIYCMNFSTTLSEFKKAGIRLPLQERIELFFQEVNYNYLLKNYNEYSYKIIFKKNKSRKLKMKRTL